MSLSTISIGGVDYVSFASVAEASEYLAVDPVRAATWSALSAENQGIFLVAATRRLNIMKWDGSKVGDEGVQGDAWPRTGVTYANGTRAGSDTEVPPEVGIATILLAGTIASKPASSGAGTSGSNQKRLKAGSAEIEYFKPTAGKPLQDETAFAMIQEFLAGSGITSAAVGGASSGTGADSVFSEDYLGYGLDQGFS